MDVNKKSALIKYASKNLPFYEYRYFIDNIEKMNSDDINVRVRANAEVSRIARRLMKIHKKNSSATSRRRRNVSETQG